MPQNNSQLCSNRRRTDDYTTGWRPDPCVTTISAIWYRICIQETSSMSFLWRSMMSLSATAIFLLLIAAPGFGQTPSRTATRTTAQIPRMPDGKPNFTGLWQALGTADWDIKPHSAHAGPFFQLAAEGAEPAGGGIVAGGDLPS